MFRRMPRKRGRRRRRPSERILLSVIACIAALSGMAGVAMGYVVWSLGKVERLDVASALTAAEDSRITASDIVAGAPEQETESAAPLGAASADASPETFAQLEVFRSNRPAENYLIVGSDSVEGVDADDAVLTNRDAQAENHLADTIMVLRLTPDGTAAVVSVPRDLLVTIAGTNRTALVNSSFNLADREERARRLIETVQENLDIELQHFIEIDLDGFRQVVDALGGIEVCFERDTRDRNTDDSGDASKGGTGFVATSGVNQLNGTAALAFVRSRHLLTRNEDGSWDRLGFWNDQERSARQQQFIVDVVDQAFASAVSSPTTVRRLLDVVADNMATSNTISLFDDGLDLARLFRVFDSSDLERYAFEVFDNEIRGVPGLSLIESSTNERILEVFRGIGWDSVVEDRVSVSVIGDQAALVVADLDALGFDSRRGTASGESIPDGTFVVRYGVGGQLAAVVLASHLRSEVTMVGDPTLSGNEVIFEIGAGTPLITEDFGSVTLPPEVSAPANADAVEVESAPAAPVPRAAGLCL
jgi:LCP family protein required for cell wall assembly